MTPAVTILDIADCRDRGLLESLRSDPRIEVIDRVALQRESLRRLCPSPDPDLLTEPTRWVYYPWRRAVVHILGPLSFHRLRLDRNRNMITTDEQHQLAALRIGVVGLSAGHVIAHTLAAEGLCGRLRLADHDELELSNLNRVPAGLFDLGDNKASVAARRIAELDPYLDVEIFTTGLASGNIDAFLDGLDIVVEECDSLDVKVVLRRAARARGLPVLMATSDRGLVDVERFDLDPTRPILHGLLADADIDALAELPAREKIPHVLRIVDAAEVSARGTASMVEVGHTVSTWPQLAGDVISGAATVAEAVRRLGLSEPLRSGRVRLDVSDALDRLSEPDLPPEVFATQPHLPAPPVGTAEIMAAAARLAPSGGNSQPWHIEVLDDAVVIDLAPDRTSTMDVGFRGSAVAIGAAIFNARVAAAAQSALGSVEVLEFPHPDIPLRGVVRLGGGSDAHLAQKYDDMLCRATNRHRSGKGRLSPAIADALRTATSDEGGRLVLIDTTDEILNAATLLGEADRIRYLSARLHSEMISELRWPEEKPDGAGIDVRSLELDASDQSTLAILRRSDVMAWLADWGGGNALSKSSRDTVSACVALAVVAIPGTTLRDYAQGGQATESLWVTAQQLGVAVHPVSPAFLYAVEHSDFAELSPAYASSLRALQESFIALAGIRSGESIALILRLSHSPAPSVRSLRRRPQESHSDANN